MSLNCTEAHPCSFLLLEKISTLAATIIMATKAGSQGSEEATVRELSTPRVSVSTCYRTYGSAKIPGVSSWLEVHDDDDPLLMPLLCGQSANNPSQTPKHVRSLHASSFPIVSAAMATGGVDPTTTSEAAVRSSRVRRVRPLQP